MKIKSRGFTGAVMLEMLQGTYTFKVNSRVKIFPDIA
jgi:hypothetical protein